MCSLISLRRYTDFSSVVFVTDAWEARQGMSQLGIVELTTQTRENHQKRVLTSFKVDFHCRVIFLYERA